MVEYTKSVLITGGTTGLGYHCALHIAKQFPDYLIVVASRTDKDSSAATINAALKQSNTIFLPLDLSSLAGVRGFVKDWQNQGFAPIQALVLNAGIQFPQGQHFSADGIEKTFAVNHVGHALLFHLLRPHLAESARIVMTASGTHDPAQKTGLPDAKYTTAQDLATGTFMDAGLGYYSTSKLTNVMWMYALHRRLNGTKLTVTAMDPGLMPGTNLAREYNPVLRFLWFQVLPHILPLVRLLFMSSNVHSPDESGLALARLAVGSDVQGVSGKYYEGLKIISSSADSMDEPKQEELWNWTIERVAENTAERERFQQVA